MFTKDLKYFIIPIIHKHKQQVMNCLKCWFLLISVKLLKLTVQIGPLFRFNEQFI